MSHLTNRELSVLHDEALAGDALRRAERHLAECAACREALAALSAREAALGEALSHEPGDAYFATFADRVNARISEAGGATAPARGVVGRPKTAEREGGESGKDVLRAPFGLPWWQSPRGLAIAGAVTAVIAGAGIVLMTARQAELPLAARDASLVARAKQVEQEGGVRPRVGAEDNPVASPEPRAAGDNARSPADAVAESAIPAQPAPTTPALEGRRDATGTRMGEVRRGTDREERAAPAVPPAGFAAAPKAASESASPTVKMRELKRAALMSSNEKAGKSEAAGGEAGGVADQAAQDVLPGTSPPPRMKENAPAPASTPGRAPTPVPAAALLKDQGTRAIERDRAAAPSASLDKVAPRSLTAARQDELRPVCGTVRDDRGRPLAGVSVTAPAVARTTVTGADGRFCLALPPGEHALQLLAVGFRAGRLTVPAAGTAGELAATLQPVTVLATGSVAGAGRAGLTTRGLAQETQPGDAKMSESISNPALSNGEAGLAALPDSIRTAAAEVARHQADAFGISGPDGFERAARSWEGLLPVAGPGAAELEVRARIAECRYFAWRRAGDARSGERGLDALTRYIARAPAGERRDLATRWLEQLRGR